MRNSPTSVGSRAADTRSTVRAGLDQGHSSVASSFNSTLLAGVLRKTPPTPRDRRIRRLVSVFLRSHKITRSAVALDYRRGARARQVSGGRGTVYPFLSREGVKTHHGGAEHSEVAQRGSNLRATPCSLRLRG